VLQPTLDDPGPVVAVIEVEPVVVVSDDPPASGEMAMSPVVNAPPHAGVIDAMAPRAAVARKR
jgi:hypothetical protein